MLEFTQKEMISQEQLVEIQEEPIISLTECLTQTWDLGLNFTLKSQNVQIIRQRFIKDMKCISEHQFDELLNMCESIPGSTTVQLLIVTSMHATGGSLKAGLLTFLIFSFPWMLIAYLIQMTVRQLQLGKMSSLIVNFAIINVVLPGFRVTTIAFLLNTIINYGKKLYNNQTSVLNSLNILIANGILYYIKPQIEIIFIGLACSVLIGWFAQEQNQNKYIQIQTNKDKFLLRKLDNFIFGWKSMIIFLIIYGLVNVIPPFGQDRLWILFSSFYKIGSLTLGNQNMVLSLVHAQLSPYKLVYTQELYNGFSIWQVLPGPLFNLGFSNGGNISSKYSGYTLGCITGYLAILLPSLLFLFWIIPLWKTFNHQNQSKIKRVKQNVYSASMGYILVSTVKLYQFELRQTVFPYWGMSLSLVLALSLFMTRLNIFWRMKTLVICLITTVVNILFFLGIFFHYKPNELA